MMPTFRKNIIQRIFLCVCLLVPCFIIEAAQENTVQSGEHGRKSGPIIIHPSILSSATHITITFPKNHPKNVSIRSPKGDWYVVHEKSEHVSLLPYRQFLLATSVKIRVSEIRGVKWLDGKRIVERVFNEPGEYLFYMADNLETEPENTYSMMATIVYKPESR